MATRLADEAPRRQDDVEVYLFDCSIERAMTWVMSAAASALDGPTDIEGAVALYPPAGAIVFTPRVENGPWLGVWFNTPDRPWDTDVECARSAAAEVGCVVRCDPGREHPVKWLEIDGESERLVEWPESDGDEPEGG